MAVDEQAYVFVEEGKEFTFGEYKYTVDQCAKGLLSMGFRKGDSLMIFCPNTTSWWIIFSACARIGVMSASVHPGYSKQEFFNAMDKVKAKAIFIPEKFKTLHFYQNLCKWIPEITTSAPGQVCSKQHPNLTMVICDANRPLPGTVHVSEVFAGGNANLQAVEAEMCCDDPLTVIFTSGTTGAAKAACLTHHSFINNVRIAHRNLTAGDTEASTKLLCPLPFFHVFGLLNMFHPLISHTPTIVPAVGYDQLQTMKAIHEYRCTQMSGSPTMYIDLLNHPERSKYDLSSMKRCIMGGAICTPEIRQQVEENFGNETMALIGYGSTETSTVATSIKPTDPPKKRLQTVGKPIAHTEIKIANPETGVELPCGETGEIWIRGFNIFSGYIDEEAKTKEVLTSTRWYRSGDIGTMDSEGFIYVVGRLKDLIIRGGENVHPIDIEIELDAHPAVEQSQVVGVPDKRMGEEICAFVSLKENKNATAEELRDFLKGKIAYFKIPKYFLFEHDLPKTAIGKVQKHKLREKAIEELGL